MSRFDNTRTNPRDIKLNIFALDEQPILAARYANDYHVSKMVTETAQILCTVHHIYASSYDAGLRELFDREVKPFLYKPTHRGHPCVRWASENQSNYRWLYLYFQHLSEEFEYRRGKRHGARVKFPEMGILSEPPFNQIGARPTRPPLVATNRVMLPYYHGDAIPTFQRLVLWYRDYYAVEKFHLGKWTGREVPSWFANYHLGRGGRLISETVEIRGTSHSVNRIVYDPGEEQRLGLGRFATGEYTGPDLVADVQEIDQNAV